ncbi:MAG: nucleoside triphosphate pyrophosphohydrolase [Victivallaceae bacterium]|nr:nucleoside triphosphate pyrophosphohydrolase [Victivallaceae bacterium]
MKDYAKERPTAEELLEVMRVLRSPKGCPWDREQTRGSLRKCLVEETAELADAIDENDPHGIAEETGDVLMNLMLQALIGEENGEFTFSDAIKIIYDKMLRRHPHVFGDASAASSAEVVKLWEKVKSAEPEKAARASVLDGVPKSLSALSQAAKIQKKAAKCGFDWRKADDVADKLQEEVDELREAMAAGDDARIDEELGDVLFAAVNLARFRKTDPEQLLRQDNAKFARRFRHVEDRVRNSGREWSAFSVEELENFWTEAKIAEQKPSGGSQQF